eukprot:CAMPEP_0178441914 /NCGR_PEP_ID=MMETSP0689_2-20121128/37814_1 /TAXON_ID=160604 /ORGANISM="Amphidinium massartii, Strain CS-259" /LENGTH=84 /DNA_ID=CAMNT_0020065283 /DNA_START=189 /DNA_END=444 /DNA_ORIENTATION=-
MICCPSAEKFSKQMEQDAECPSGLSSSKSRASNGTTSSCSNKPSGAALGLRGKRTKPRVTKKNIKTPLAQEEGSRLSVSLHSLL